MLCMTGQVNKNHTEQKRSDNKAQGQNDNQK